MSEIVSAVDHESDLSEIVSTFDHASDSKYPDRHIFIFILLFRNIFCMLLMMMMMNDDDRSKVV